MYQNTPIIAAPGAAGAGLIAQGGGPVLPNTGGPHLAVLLGAALVLITVGALLAVRRPRAAHRRPTRSRWPDVTVAVLAAALMVLMVVGAVSAGLPGPGWSLVGLAVALFTVGYLALAVRSLLPSSKTFWRTAS